MRTIAAMIAGLLLSTATFFAGLIIALTYLNAGEPDHQLNGQNTAALWTTEPVAVEKVSQSFERLPARPQPKTEEVAAVKKTGTGSKAITSVTPATYAATDQTVDPVITGAIQTQPSATADSRDTWQNASHVQWCSNRYRSYRAADNTYRPYGGGRRACQSPYFNVATADPPEILDASDDAATANVEDRSRIKEVLPEMEQALYQDVSGDYVDGDHVQSCFERYRSYRPEDNSYQPFDGGPRRQCD